MAQIYDLERGADEQAECYLGTTNAHEKETRKAPCDRPRQTERDYWDRAERIN